MMNDMAEGIMKAMELKSENERLTVELQAKQEQLDRFTVLLGLKVCERCIGTGEVDCGDASNGLVQCPDCDGEGKLDAKGFAPSYGREDHK